MQTFTDAGGRSWPITINVRAIRRVRDHAGADLMQIAGGELLAKLGTDPVLLVDVLWALVMPKAQADGVTADAFAEAMVGDAIESATLALLHEMTAFFPSQTRVLLQRVLDAAKVQQDRAQALAGAGISELERRLSMPPGAPSPTAPASSDATPIP